MAKTTTRAESASENDRTAAGSVPAAGSKQQTIREAFKAAKALTQEDEDEPRPEQRRKGSGETEAAFMGAARALFRRVVQIPAEAYDIASGYLCNTLEWLNVWEANSGFDDDPAQDFDTKYDYLSLHM